MKFAEREELIAELAKVINASWDEKETKIASFYAGEDGDEQAARKLISTFIEYCDDLKINPDGSEEATACLHAFRKMLERVLAVDMEKPSNRKGDLPKAMGLAVRRDAEKGLRDSVIVDAYDCVKYSMGISGRPDEECFDLVATALEATGKFGDIEDGGLTTDNIKKICQRSRV